MIGQKWFRYDIVDVSIFLGEYEVVRQTPARVYFANGEFATVTARKRWACPTIEEARESFIRRKTRQIGIMEPMLARARKALAAAQEGSWPEKPGDWKSFGGTEEFTFVELTDAP